MCVETRCSFGGAVICLAGGMIAYKSKFHPTVAGSSTEAKIMAAYDTGKMILFICAIGQSALPTMWGLGCTSTERRNGVGF